MQHRPTKKTEINEPVPERRDFLTLSAVTVGAAGAALSAWPFLDYMNPSADVLSLSTTDVDLAPIMPGQRITVIWQGKPVFIARRTQIEINRAKADDDAKLKDPAADASRAGNPEWLIAIGICTHLGCIPLGQNGSDPRGQWSGWFCPCHGSHYDTAGRIRKGPAPRNLDLLPYRFFGEQMVRVGDKGG